MKAIQGIGLKQILGLKMNRPRNIEDMFNLNGKFFVQHERNGLIIAQYPVPNGITNVGKLKLFDVMFNDATPIANSAWCLSLINNSGFTALAAADTMSSHGGWTEFTNYDEATRVAWGSGAAASNAISNATACTFTINASGTVNGIFVTSVNTKSGTTGTLWSTGSFSSPVDVVDDDQLKITYGIAA